MTTATRTRTRTPRRDAEAAPGIASLDESGLDALIARVEEALEHDFALGSADLALLLDALITLAAVAERLEHNDLTIARLKKLLGFVRSSEKLKDLVGALGGGEAAGADAAAEDDEHTADADAARSEGVQGKGLA